jgi:hypothetical protein
MRLKHPPFLLDLLGEAPFPDAFPNPIFPPMSETASLFTALRQPADPAVVDAIERLVRDAPDKALCRINALDFAAREGLDEERVIAGFLHAARLGLFDLSWNILCRSCAGVLDANSSLKTVTRPEYHCAFCAAGYEPAAAPDRGA